MAVKITINGEDFLFNQDHRPMSEALAVEEATGMPYGQWEQDLAAGSVKALAVFCWLVWRRNGREVDLGQILDGTIEVDLGGLMDSLAEIAKDTEGNTLDPTMPDTSALASGATPAHIPTTPPSTGRSSRRSTGSARGKSAT